MAFMGILLVNVIVIILLIILLLFIISLIGFIISFILSRLDKTKRVRKIVSIVFGILTIVFFIPLLAVTILIHNGNKETIEYNGKKYKVYSKIVDDFQNNIENCDIDKIDYQLKKKPELINSNDYEGSLPLGTSIKYKKMECVKYFVDKDVDINNVSINSEYGTLEYIFSYNYYDEEILEYLLSLEKLDINKRHLAMPVAQLYIDIITEDKIISSKEIDIFNKLLEKRLDLNATNGIDENTYQYVKDSKFDKVENIEKLRNIINEK